MTVYKYTNTYLCIHDNKPPPLPPTHVFLQFSLYHACSGTRFLLVVIVGNLQPLILQRCLVY